MAVAGFLAGSRQIGRGWLRRWSRFRLTAGVHPTPWTIGTLLAVALVLLPLVAVLSGLVQGGSETWDHLAATVLGDYIRNSALLVVAVGAMTLVIGVPTAWLVTVYDFPGRRVFEWALILPLAIPTYIIAYTYAQMLGHAGPVQRLLQVALEPATTAGLRTSLMSLPGAALLISLVLYPYVYLITRSAFLRQSGGILESARILGKSPGATFREVALPLARPGIVAGLTLVLMEVLNEYGAVRYFGVSTFTTGIFRAWFSLGDPPAALRLSTLLLLFVFLLVILERTQRGRARFDDGSSRPRPVVRYSLRGWKRMGAFTLCAAPLLLGFILPVLQLLHWATQVTPDLLDPRFLRLTLNSFGLGFAAALLTVSVGLLIVYATRLSPAPLLRWAARSATLGYSIPGAVLAVGTLIPFIWLDRQVALLVRNLTGNSIGLLLTGTLGALLFAYLVRFLAVALNPIDSGFERTCRNVDEAARSLGTPPLRTLLRVDIPLLRGAILTAGLLVFVDVLKELPLTLILRPFNFDTLATRAFQLAMDEQVARSSLPALLIILTGLVPILILSRLIRGEREGGSVGEDTLVPALPTPHDPAR